MEAVSTKPIIPPVFESAKGSWLISESGVRFFDATAGSGAVSLGHQHPCVVNACTQQIGNLIHTGCKLNSSIRVRLAEKISSLVPIKNASVLFSVIGTEAVESSFKIARSHTKRSKIICFEHAYHGKSHDALGTTWRSSFKEFSRINDADYVRFPLPYVQGCEDDIDLVHDLDSRIADSLSRYEDFLLDCAGQGDSALPAAFIIEPIQVTEGVLLPPRQFVEGLIALSREHGVISIIDEIYTAFGRCGSLFYCDTLSVVPDMMLLGKSMANGFPISLVAGGDEIMKSLPSGTQTSTYSGSPLSAAAALAVVDFVVENEIWHTANENGLWMKNLLEHLQSKYSLTLEIRQRGMLLAFEFKKDGENVAGLAKQFIKFAFNNGLLLFGGGYNNENIKVIPPILLDEVEKKFLEISLDKTFNDLFR